MVVADSGECGQYDTPIISLPPATPIYLRWTGERQRTLANDMERLAWGELDKISDQGQLREHLARKSRC